MTPQEIFFEFSPVQYQAHGWPVQPINIWRLISP